MKVEHERSRQLGGLVKTIDARRKREAPQILPRHVKGAWQAGGGVVGSGSIDLSLRRDCIACVYCSYLHYPRWEANHRGSRTDTQIASDVRDSRIGNGRGAQDRKGFGCAKSNG